ncbi:hypothetical protein HN662_02165, partial [Candidatus Woesearchaeota archaeon]|nr:hypothetical protein [Candidatus Woesearchaeota archaeon]
MTKRIKEDYFKGSGFDQFYLLGAFYGGAIPFGKRGIIFRSSNQDLVEIVKRELESEHAIASDNREGKSSHWLRVGSTGSLREYLDDHKVLVPKKERSFPKKEPKEKSTGTSSSLALYVLLFIIAALDLFAKKSIGYEPKAALLISTVTGIIFFLSTKSHPGQRLTVIGAFVLDAAFSQGLLYLVPETGIKETLIAIHVFIWIILAVILFLWNFFEHLAEGHKPSVLADLTFVAILGFIIFISYPLIIETQLIQANTHSDYFQVAKEKAEEVKVKFSETSQKWSDYLQCSLEKDAKDPSIQPCLKKKRAERFCENDNKPLSPNYNKCVQNLLEEGKAIGGKTDSSYTEHSSLKFNTEEFPGTVYTGLPNPKIILEINNPRELSLSVDFYCNFSKLKENFPGTPSPITLTKLDDNFKE